MFHKKFIEFIHKLEIEHTLLETIIKGYNIIFESMNAWEPNNSPYLPFINPVGEPMGSYQNIMKQVPSSIGASGGSADNSPTGNQTYQYEPSLPECRKNEETVKKEINKKITPNTLPITKKLIKNAENHIPKYGDNMFTPINYYNNFPLGTQLGKFDVDSTKMPPF